MIRVVVEEIINPNLVYTINDVGEFLKVKNSVVKRLVQTDKIKYRKIGRNVRFLGTEILEYLGIDYLSSKIAKSD